MKLTSLNLIQRGIKGKDHAKIKRSNYRINEFLDKSNILN